MSTAQEQIKKPLPERLKAWRAFKGFTQRQAADYFGAAMQTYQSWEQGRVEPRGATARGVERGMGEC